MNDHTAQSTKISSKLRRKIEQLLHEESQNGSDPLVTEVLHLIDEWERRQAGSEPQSQPDNIDPSQVHWVEGQSPEQTGGEAQQVMIERRQVEKALAQTQNLLRTLIDNFPDFIFAKDTKSRFVLNNEAHLRILGAETQEAVQGKSDFDFFPNELAAQYYADEQAVIQSGRPLHGYEEPYIDHAGDLRWVSTTKVPLRDGHGNIVGLVGMCRDITGHKRSDELLREAHDELEMRVLERTAELAKANTILQTEIVERKQADQALRESEARLAGILDIAREAIISVDQTQRIIIFNKGSEAIFGYAADEIMGQPLDLLIPDRFQPSHHQHIIEFAEGPTDARRMGERIELFGRRKNGAEFPAESSISRLRLGDQTIFTVVLRDITERKRVETALRESEQRYKKLVGSVTDYIYTVHLENGQPTRTTHSPNCVAVTGYTSQDYDTDPNLWFRMIYEADQNAVTEQTEALLRDDAVPALEHRIIHKDGSIRWVRNTPVLRKDEHGQIRSYDGLIANITERKLAEEALRKSEGKYRRLMEQASDGIILANELGDILEANPRIFDMLGYDRAELLALNIRDLIYREDLADTSFGLEEVQTGRTVLIERRLCRKDGTLIPVETSATKLEDGRLQAILRDITERKRAEAERERLFEEVKAGRERLQALSHRLVEVQEAERRHIARELHDETGQLLTGLKLTLEMSASFSGEALQANLDEAHSLISELITQVRELSLELRPAMLDDLGLVPTLLWHFERYTAQTQIQVNFKHSGLDGRFRSEVETTAYRIVQEALTNIARHAKVNVTTVRLWLEAEALNVQIEDEGAGFDPEAAQAAATSSGLSGMAERAALLGGRLSIESRPRAGTRLTAQLPLGRNIVVDLDLKS